MVRVTFAVSVRQFSIVVVEVVARITVLLRCNTTVLIVASGRTVFVVCVTSKLPGAERVSYTSITRVLTIVSVRFSPGKVRNEVNVTVCGRLIVVIAGVGAPTLVVIVVVLYFTSTVVMVFSRGTTS